MVKSRESREHRRSIRIDKILTDKYLAIPVFLGIMFAIFWLTFNVIGAVLSDLLSLGITELTDLVDAGLNNTALIPWFTASLLMAIFPAWGAF